MRFCLLKIVFGKKQVYVVSTTLNRPPHPAGFISEPSVRISNKYGHMTRDCAWPFMPFQPEKARGFGQRRPIRCPLSRLDFKGYLLSPHCRHMTTTAAPAILKVKGDKIVDGEGNPVLLRGAGLGGWMNQVRIYHLFLKMYAKMAGF